MIYGPIRSQPGGPVEKVVVAGGYNGIHHAISTTEIYDLATDSWSKGTPLPVALFGAAVVPYDTTFLVIGGAGSNYSDKVYLYETSGEWSEQPHMKLSQPKYDVAAMLVPSSLFDQV